jgi:branched-chain amino acid aminotransferase
VADAVAYTDGRVVPLEAATVPMTDRGFLLGDGVFETLRTVGRRPFRWDLHAERLSAGLATLGLPTAAVLEAEEALARLVQAADGDHELYLRIQVTRDASVREPADADGVVTGIARPLVPYPGSVYRHGVRLATVAWRKDPHDPLAAVKHLSYLPYLMARRQAHAAGADDALILNTNGRVCEASHSNVLAVVGDVLHAPGVGEGALDGVTRRLLLDSEAVWRTTIVDRITPEALAHADEVLLTNTVGGVVPVSRVDDSTHPAGAGGAWYARLLAAYEALVTT